eukprot:CAMPEP_0194496218 /NCGR_PEP_ID=MMETSP0253-20130528/13563_1 /TAXON_ID=2966 /ORGANISM="Noctiluca scintillans" /LENGTH=537 /DNA_ID=CAMNT_0039337589 /DNA_START=65 /DNA_END=1678 /DNA_ORIENTATION=-
MLRPLAFSVIVSVQGVRDIGSMRLAFDSLANFANLFPANYDDDLFQGITTCLATGGDSLYPLALNAAWNGWSTYGIQGGQPGDEWNTNITVGYQEYDPSDLTYEEQSFKIVEPCNTLSNLAYYRILPDLCANRAQLKMDDERVGAIIQSFAMMGLGSTMMHASRTMLGYYFDNQPIAIIAYNYQQQMTGSLTPVGNTTASVLSDLSVTARPYNAIQLSKQLYTIPLSNPLHTWTSMLEALDVPWYYVTFAAIVTNALTLTAPDAINDKLIPLLMSAFGLSDKDQQFMVGTYLPAIRGALAQVEVSLAEKVALVPKFVGTLLKILYAFVWQEHVFKYGALYNTAWNLLGAYLIPTVNSLSNKLTGFSHPDASIQESSDVYPGDDSCSFKASAPHAKWHEQSANGLMDIGYLADAFRTALDNAQARSSSPSSRTLGETQVSDVILSTSVVDEWQADTKAEPWTEAYIKRQAFGLVVKDIASVMDACVSGEADGSVTWEELTCYVSGVTSVAQFIDELFANITKYTDLLAPTAELVVAVV